MGLYENMLKEPVSRLNLRDAITGPPELSIRDAVQRMRAGRLGCIFAVDAEQRPVGMFTEAILRNMLATAPAGIDDSLADHMTRQFPRAETGEPILTVMEGMQAENHRFVCVVDDDGRVAGLTGQKGLMEYIADHFPEAVLTQCPGATPLPEREGA